MNPVPINLALSSRGPTFCVAGPRYIGSACAIGIGAAAACDYFREVVAAEAELARLLRSGGAYRSPTRHAPSQQRVSDFRKGARFEKMLLPDRRIEVEEH